MYPVRLVALETPRSLWQLSKASQTQQCRTSAAQQCKTRQLSKAVCNGTTPRRSNAEPRLPSSVRSDPAWRTTPCRVSPPSPSTESYSLSSLLALYCAPASDSFPYVGCQKSGPAKRIGCMQLHRTLFLLNDIGIFYPSSVRSVSLQPLYSGCLTNH